MLLCIVKEFLILAWRKKWAKLKQGTFIYYNEKETFWNQNKRNVLKEWTVNYIHEQACGWSLFCYDVHGKRYKTEFESDILFRNKILPQSIEQNGQIITVQFPAAALIFLFVITYHIWSMRWSRWLRYCATRGTVAVRFPMVSST